jgi:UDP-N-acetyl-alpha-D-muramoyl-L-alanyl-L-glutamate epimerase
MPKFYELRKDYPVFIYESFSSIILGSDLKIKFRFIQSEEIIFEPEIIFRNCISNNFDPDDLNSAVFNIGMIELISYYKACCSPKILIKAGYLKKDQIEFWKSIYFNGLGEFLYKNKISTTPDELFSIESASKTPDFAVSKAVLNDSGMIPVGGGKDSAVTLELLSGRDYLPLILNPRKASTDCVKNAGYPGFFEITRKLDPLIIELNGKGFLNGHTPFSALLAFISSAAALLNGRKDIVLSNENSANEGNTFFSGIEINHQYSKSFNAEKSLHEYFCRYIHPNLNYFSLLRPLNELKIAELFSRYKNHFHDFRSCNAGSKEDRWCLKCPKCLFTYIILSPFIPSGILSAAFGKDLLDDSGLENIFFELTGQSGIKPLECVGTPSEIRAAIFKNISSYGDKNLPYLLDQFKKRSGGIKQEDITEFHHIINEFNSENLLDKKYLDIMTAAL